jgi:hypothetical protein
MKPRRVILVVEHEVPASVLRCVLENNHYRVLTVKDVDAEISAWRGIDLVVIGARTELDESRLPIASLRLQPAMSTQQMLERIRVLVIRKRGPKKAGATLGALAEGGAPRIGAELLLPAQ